MTIQEIAHTNVTMTPTAPVPKYAAVLDPDLLARSQVIKFVCFQNWKTKCFRVLRKLTTQPNVLLPICKELFEFPKFLTHVISMRNFSQLA